MAMNLSNILIVLSSDETLNSKLKNSELFLDLTRNKETKIDSVTLADQDGKNFSSLSSESYDIILAVEQNFEQTQTKKFYELLRPDSRLGMMKTNLHPDLIFSFKMAGFLVDETDSESDLVIFRRPSYQVGSSVQVKFDAEDQATLIKKKIWSLNVDDIADQDLIDDEELLDAEDRAKPRPEDLRVCASTKLQKACANCSCGLKEELENEEIEKIKSNTQNAKSSCGNCYLGDAFRCSSCPYRGMPAFKPGEKVLIDNVVDDL